METAAGTRSSTAKTRGIGKATREDEEDRGVACWIVIHLKFAIDDCQGWADLARKLIGDELGRAD